ncbi:MAG: EamA family transporter [Candidatus Poribacteria bacterium]|nr:EamA family transporter [Candidatus Poribacteria bacterium]
MRNYILLVINVLLTVIGQILMKQGMTEVGEIDGSLRDVAPRLIQAFMNPFVISGISIYGFTTMLWLIILSRVKLSIAYPMLSLGYLFSIFFAWLLFKESVPKARILGAIIICLGVYFVASSE